jgi:hypothetical protein
LNDSGGVKGQGRMIVRVFNAAGLQVGQTLSESDGYYSFSGLIPGVYTVRMDVEQLSKLNLSVNTAEKTFTLIASEEGSLVDRMNFILRHK